MQLILDAESSVEFKTNMSLSGENLEKCVSDILSDVKNEGISNGNDTNGNEEAAGQDNTDLDKVVKLKQSVQINSVKTVDNETTISKNYDIEGNNVDIQTSRDCESSGILNGNLEILTNSEPNDQSHDSIDSIEKENTNVKKNITNSELIDRSQHIIDSIEEENTNVEKNNTNSELVDQSQNIIDSIEEENTNVKENITNFELVDQAQNIIDCVEEENTNVEKNITNSDPVDQSQNIIDSTDKENTNVKKNITNSEQGDEPQNIIDSIENENATVENKNSDNESGIVETALKNYGSSQSNVNEQLSESESALTEPITVCNNVESESTTPKSSDKGSVNADAIHDNAVSSCIARNVSSSECENAKKDNDETENSDSKQTNFNPNCDVRKLEIGKNYEEKLTGSDSPLAIEEELDNEVSNDKDTKMEISTIAIDANLLVSESKLTMETDYTENDNSDENIDLIRLDVNSDIPQDYGVQETRTEILGDTDSVEKENPNTDNVTKMDVDESASGEQEIKELKVTPTEKTAEKIESKICDLIEPDKTETISTLDLNSFADGIVNLDDDKEKPTVTMEKAECTEIKVDDGKSVINCDDDTDAVEKVDKSVMEGSKLIDEIIDLDENVPKETCDSKFSEENKIQDNNKSSIESKPMEPVLKLSNTLDILSDDEEEQEKKSNDSKCINIEDDDDVMLIDDDTTTTENKSEPVKERDVEKESKPTSPTENVKMTEDSESPDTIDKIPEKVSDTLPEKEREATPTPDISETHEESKLQTEKQKPLIPENFLKTCKKNLVDMTREELEEFCVLKIVESILDRSSLSEIKNKLKVLTQNIEDYKKKALMLSKQNRDLQVVLKSIQDDIKKNNEAPIVPLKITRSVGMQVLMADKPDKRRRTGIGMPNTNKQLRTPAMQNPRPQKPPTQQIPVPRLVPANNTAIKSPNTQQVNTGKVTSPLPNGVKNVSPAQKVEKRPHNRIQSVTVDLTDDEPPSKVVNRTQNPVPPVRLVPSQNLLAAPRTPCVNSPRKVYIPISGPQAQNVRPGQTIMLKTVPSSSPRQRVPPPHMVRMPQTLRMPRPQALRHPAPLPECMKQYQPPNWKALPPAPDLKLAKVENGIVISWKIEGYQEDSYEEIASYQLYAYQETTSPPNTTLWKKIGDVKALPLPMACTLTQFMAGYKYYFAVRAVDIRSRLGPFSLPGSILLLNKM